MSADPPVDAIVECLRALVRIPSRAGEDAPQAVLDTLAMALADAGLPCRRLCGADGRLLGLYAEVSGRLGPGPWTVLDATVDTAAFGDLASWREDPCSATVREGWLHGRGSADSKAAVAIFLHLLRAWRAAPAFRGRIGLLLDADEHSGRFGGARAFFDQPDDSGHAPRPDGVLIGYPGLDRVVAGCRGFLRAEVVVHGVAAHAGSSRQNGVNAVMRAARLAQALADLPLPGARPDFALPPKLTVVGLEGGSAGYTQVPDRCTLRLDLRLTPAWPAAAAQAAVAACVAASDTGRGEAAPTEIAWLPGWPAYRLPDHHPLVAAMLEGCRRELGQAPPVAVVGPSNIGNYLASLGVPALCGFGVRAEGLHAANERMALDSIAPVYRVYRAALARLHGAADAG